MSRCRIADDFPAIRARLDELRREEARVGAAPPRPDARPMGPPPFHASELSLRLRQREESAAARRLRMPGLALPMKHGRA